MKEAITITVGTVIGVGLFTVGSQVVGNMGSTIIIATFVAMLISIYPARLYAEMGAALPYAGGTYKYASLALGRPFGMLAGWNFIISLVAVTSGEALAFSFYIRTALEVLGLSIPLSDVAIAVIIVAVFIATNIMGVEMTGRLQNGMMFFFWGVALIWFLMMIPHVDMGRFVTVPSYLDLNTGNFILWVALIWWCYAGFETCCAMGEEIKYPQINIPRALFLAPVIVFVVNAMFQWFLVGIVPTAELLPLATADAPYADAMKAAGVLGFPLFMLAIGISLGGDFSTLNASVAVPPRYLFTMARDGSMPAVFAKIHPKYRSPYIAILTIGVLAILLISTDSIVYIASLSLFGDLFYYVIGIAASIFLRYRHPELHRPYKAPLIQIGAPVSIIIYLIMMMELDSEAFWTGIIWCALGLAIYFTCRKIYGDKGDEELTDLVMTVENPTAEEKAKMDREYKIWRAVVWGAFAIVVCLYALPWIIR
ncbi:amino acid permease [Deltaproteobacteria bacterium OttesenSCG-928-K17]|nr:amino acid permease [Deltaproteobacteria bacterium OttesenSCG-928-K17]